MNILCRCLESPASKFMCAHLGSTGTLRVHKDYTSLDRMSLRPVYRCYVTSVNVQERSIKDRERDRTPSLCGRVRESEPNLARSGDSGVSSVWDRLCPTPNRRGSCEVGGPLCLSPFGPYIYLYVVFVYFSSIRGIRDIGMRHFES